MAKQQPFPAVHRGNVRPTASGGEKTKENWQWKGISQCFTGFSQCFVFFVFEHSVSHVIYVHAKYFIVHVSASFNNNGFIHVDANIAHATQVHVEESHVVEFCEKSGVRQRQM